jgi:hypothetical protein
VVARHNLFEAFQDWLYHQPVVQKRLHELNDKTEINNHLHTELESIKALIHKLLTLFQVLNPKSGVGAW